MDAFDTQETKHVSNWRKYCAIAGEFLLIIPNGIYAMWGSISVYALSHVYVHHGISRGLQTPWELPAYLFFNYVGYSIASFLLKNCPKRLFLCLMIILSYGAYCIGFVALKYDCVPLAVSTVLIVALSTGAILSTVFEYIANWSDSKKGYMISIVLSAMCFGPFLTNPLVTVYVNPNNLSPDSWEGKLKFMTQTEIIEKVPSMCLLLGTILLGTHIIGFFMINLNKTSKTSRESEEKNYGSFSSEDNGDYSEGLSDSLTDISVIESGSAAGNRDSTRTDEGVSPFQIFCTPIFYFLWLCNISRDVTSIHMNTFYKSFGQNWINDDYLLTAVGSFAGIASGIARLTWGFVLDHHSSKGCLVMVFSTIGIGILFMYFTAMLNKWLYFVVVVFCNSLRNCLLPTLANYTLILFGQSSFNKNFGFLNTATVMVDVLVPWVFEILLNYFGWFSIFGFSLSTVILALLTVVLKFPDAAEPHEVENE